MPRFTYIGRVPLEDGEGISAMAVWALMGKECIAIATDRGHMLVLRVNEDGSVDVAGPLEFTPQ